MFGATCLKKHRKQLFDIIEMLVFDPKFEHENVETIFNAYQNNVIESLTDSPMSYCLDLCSSGMNKRGSHFNSFEHVSQAAWTYFNVNLSALLICVLLSGPVPTMPPSVLVEGGHVGLVGFVFGAA